METVEMIFSCFECGFNTIDQYFWDNYLALEHPNRMLVGPNVNNELLPSSTSLKQPIFSVRADMDQFQENM